MAESSPRVYSTDGDPLVWHVPNVALREPDLSWVAPAPDSITLQGHFPNLTHATTMYDFDLKLGNAPGGDFEGVPYFRNGVARTSDTEVTLSNSSGDPADNVMVTWLPYSHSDTYTDGDKTLPEANPDRPQDFLPPGTSIGCPARELWCYIPSTCTAAGCGLIRVRQ